MKYCYLVVSSYIKSEKFTELYALLRDALSEQGVRCDIIGNAEIMPSLWLHELRCEHPAPDFVIFWDKDVCLARQLEALGIRCFNRSESIMLCDDKWLTYERLSGAGVPQPETLCAPFTYSSLPRSDEGYVHAAISLLGLPLVIKERSGSFGQQVYLAESAEQALEISRSLGSRPFVFQRFVSASVGRDIRVNVVGGRAVCAMERRSDNDFRSNLTLGGHAASLELSAELALPAEKAARALGLSFAGVDLLYGESGMLVCEVNSNPHFKTTLDTCGVNLAPLIARLAVSEVYG